MRLETIVQMPPVAAEPTMTVRSAARHKDRFHVRLHGQRDCPSWGVRSRSELHREADPA